MKNKKLIFLAMLFVSVFGMAKSSLAATINAATCSLVDVTAAYNTASAEDTIMIPAGSCTWTGQLTITKSITIMGSGGSNTRIIRDAGFDGATALIKINPSSDVPVRISGIYFEQGPVTGNAKKAVQISGPSASSGSSWGYTKIRIDSNTFNKGTDVLWVQGWAYGVADHNQFINCDTGIILIGDYNAAWSRSIEAGTANAFFIENNTFTVDNNIERAPNEQVYHQSGSRSVTRYNTIDGTAYTAGSTLFVDSHGNWGGTAGLDYRGQPIIEVYNNTVKAYQSYRFMHIRGGSSLIYNNSMTTITSPGNSIVLDEEESWQTVGSLNPLKTIWPADDQINNTFIWDNTLNGAAITSIKLGNANDSIFIQKDRDYFMHAPQATGGQEILADGGSPYYKRTNTMTFSSSEANAYYPYTPYTYPHPLTITADTTPPSPPTGLSVD